MSLPIIMQIVARQPAAIAVGLGGIGMMLGFPNAGFVFLAGIYTFSYSFAIAINMSNSHFVFFDSA